MDLLRYLASVVVVSAGNVIKERESIGRVDNQSGNICSWFNNLLTERIRDTSFWNTFHVSCSSHTPFDEIYGTKICWEERDKEEEVEKILLFLPFGKLNVLLPCLFLDRTIFKYLLPQARNWEKSQTSGFPKFFPSIRGRKINSRFFPGQTSISAVGLDLAGNILKNTKQIHNPESWQ